MSENKEIKETNRSIPQASASINLGKPSLRARLEAYYSLISPDIISNQLEWRAKFDEIYRKYGGSHEGEKKLASKLANKYGTAVRLLLANSAEENPDSHQDQNRNETEVHDEEWYCLRSAESGSGDVSFLSDCFDPMAALHVPEEDVMKVNPWVSECPLLDTVGKFCFQLPFEDPMRRIPQTRKRMASNDVAKPDVTKKSKKTNPFALIADDYEKGPLSLLYRMQRQRIRVVIRYVNAIRGTVTGTLLAFDKHMNMILRDAEEVYSPRPLHRELLSNVEMELARRQNALKECRGEGTEGWAIRQRSMKQILIRGDNVVLVYKAEEERSAWPITSKSLKSSLYRRSVPAAPESERVGSPASLIYALKRSEQKRSFTS